MNLRSIAALWLALSTALAAQSPTVRFVDGIYPLEAYPQESPQGAWASCRVLDAVSGAPIAGAELLLVAESDTPVAGEFTWLQRAVSDEYGFVALPLGRAGANWMILRAPGYGPASAGSGLPGRVWALAPAVDLPVRVLDGLDRPVPGSAVGLCLGCGHTPDVARAEADARGVALLRGVDPHNSIADVYPDHPGLGIDNYGGVDWVPGDPPAEVRASFAVALSGQVNDPEGRPVAGAFVGHKSVHRGPWTTTAADGSFRLNASEPGYDVYVVLPEAPGHEYLFELPPSRNVTLRLPAASEEACQVIDLVPTDAVAVGNGVPTLSLRVVAPPDARVVLLYEGDRSDVSAAVHAGEALELPARGEFGLEIADGYQQRVLVFGDLAAQPPKLLELSFLPATLVQGRLVDGAGGALAARFELLSARSLRETEDFDLRTFSGRECPTGRLDFESVNTGLRWLAVRPTDPSLRPQLLALHLPARATDARLELGELVFTSSPRLRILGSDGRPYAGPPAGITRAGWSDVREEPRTFPLDEQGAWLGCEPRAGDALVVPAADWDLEARSTGNEPARLALPYRQVLQGEGPWTVRVPAGELQLDVHDSAGRALDARVFVADRSIAVRGPTLLHQLAAGPLELVVTAAGRRTALVRVEIPAQGRAELALALPLHQ